MTLLELLAPARDLECGIAAIDHGADAVYIGAPSFGARAAAGNSIDDIRLLCQHAHRFRAKVYVTVNTIVYENELPEVEQLLADLCQAGVDAILVQDMALPEMIRRVARGQGRQMEIHASTQTDNRTPERVEWLRRAGFTRVVLARELPVSRMRDIHHAVPDVELEAFVHGALCVSYSGVCYASQYCFQRSANRGMCAQFCRLKFSLVDADGQTVDRPRHWLSLRDMCRIDHLREMAEAGVTSFKIEGRLKGVGYVKNVVAAYSRQLDQVVAASGGRFRRVSLGHVTHLFAPDLRKTFNRGFTPYLLDGFADGIASPDTPKALGEHVGKVKEIRHNSFNVAGTAVFANGDGLCFFDKQQNLWGFRVNRVEGNRIFPQQMPPLLQPGMALYRNADAAMEKLLSRQSATRRIPLAMTLSLTGNGLLLTASVPETDLKVTVGMAVERQEARQPQEQNMRQQLSKLGGTVYEADSVDIDDEAARLFVPSSLLATLRRKCVDAMDQCISDSMRQASQKGTKARMADSSGNDASCPHPFPREYAAHPYLHNVANNQARAFYASQGMTDVGKAFEVENPASPQLLMQCRHCIRRLLGWCSRETHRRAPWREPLYLQLPDKRRFRLQFDCQQCQMNVYAEK